MKIKRGACFAAAVILFLSGTFLHFLTRGNELFVIIPDIRQILPASIVDIIVLIGPLPALPEFIIRTLLLAFAMLFAEAGVVGWNVSSLRALLRRENRVKRDFVFTALFTVHTVPLFAAVSSLGLSYVLAGLIEFMGPRFFVHTAPEIALQFSLVLLVRSFIAYWRHRLTHTVPFLWQFHKVHHSATEMNVLNDFRNTPVALWIAAAAAAIPLQFLGTIDVSEHGLRINIVVALYHIYVSAMDANQHFIHSKVDATYGWIGRYFFVSPAYHRIHHSVLASHRDKNFSGDFVVWDRLFGTRVNPENVADRAGLPLGVEENAYDKGSILYDYFVRALSDALRTATSGRSDILVARLKYPTRWAPRAQASIMAPPALDPGGVHLSSSENTA